MNILLIGNGFDLAHGLPTKYTDFLEYVKVIKGIQNIEDLINYNIDLVEKARYKVLLRITFGWIIFLAALYIRKKTGLILKVRLAELLGV